MRELRLLHSLNILPTQVTVFFTLLFKTAITVLTGWYYRRSRTINTFKKQNNVKGKFHPITGYEDSEREYRYGSTLSLISALNGGTNYCT
jgi:hypothetical protein